MDDGVIEDVNRREAAIHDQLGQIHEQFASMDEGRVADYIPELADADPEHFGIVAVGVKGRLETSSRTMALKASPDGSTPTLASTPSRPRSSRAMP